MRGLVLLVSSNVEDVQGWAGALGAFVAFCCAASAIYLVNDLVDLDPDRAHASKRRRPFASGALALQYGLVLPPVLAAVALGLGFALGILPHVMIYAVAAVLYFSLLKTMPLVDVFTLSAFYGLRMVAGGAASGTPVSKWLFAFAGFLFLSLAFMKRVAELGALRGARRPARRGYEAGDREMLALFGTASAFAATIVLALFIQSAAAERFASPLVLSALVPLALFWLCRMWLSTARGYMLDDPIVYAARDWVSWTTVAAALAVFLVAESGVTAVSGPPGAWGITTGLGDEAGARSPGWLARQSSGWCGAGLGRPALGSAAPVSGVGVAHSGRCFGDSRALGDRRRLCLVLLPFLHP